MPGCCVEGCRNRSEHGIRMFLLPQGNRNDSRRAQWISNIGRPGLPLKSVVCEVHFTADQFENKRQDQKRLLKWNAVPTVFDKVTDKSNNRKRCKLKPCKTVKEEKSTYDVENSFLEEENAVNLNESSSRINQVEYHEGTENVNVKGQEEYDILKSDKNGDLNNHAIRRKSTRKVKFKSLQDYYLEEDLNNYFSSRSNSIEKNESLCNLKYVNSMNCEEQAPALFPVHVLGQKKSSASNKIMLVSVNDICRVCGKLRKTLLPIFGSMSRRKRVPFLINQYLPIKVSESDTGRPVNVCSICIHYLIKWEELFRKSKEVDLMFMKLSKSMAPKSLQCDLSPSGEGDTLKNLNIADSADNTNHIITKDDEFISRSNNKANRNREIISANTFNDHNYCPLDKELQQKGCWDNVNYISGSDKVTSVLSKSYTKGSEEGHDDNDFTDSVTDMENRVDSTARRKQQEYKIGITLVKSKECIQEAELDFNKLKSILIKKVDCLFQSICSDETIMKSLIKPCTAEKNDNDKQINIDNKCRKVCEVTVNIDKEGQIGNIISDMNIKEMKNNQDSCISYKRLCETLVNKNSNVKDIFDDRKTSVHNRFTNGLQSKLMKRRKLSKPSQTSSLALVHDESFLCNSCGRLFETCKSFGQHRRLHHAEKKCDYCDLTLVSFLDYRRHINESHRDKICHLCCEICGEKFVKHERLQRHKLIIHNIGDYFYCDICSKKCSSKQQLYCHKNLKHKSDENLCHFCGNKFPTHNSLATHIKSKHSSEKIHECMICGKKLKSRNSLLIHLSRHNNQVSKDDCLPTMDALNTILDKKSYSCLVCGVKIGEVDMLKQHMSYHSGDDFIKDLSGLDCGKLYCCLCSKYFEKEKDLALHRFYLHQEVPFLCQINSCELSFWHKSGLIIHQVSVHKSRSSVMCNLCNEVFKNKKQKQLHDKIQHSITVPNKNRPFECNHCPKGFPTKVSLKRHEKVHELSLQYNCHLCEKSFKLKSELSKHLDSHSINLVGDEERFVTENMDENFVTEIYENVAPQTMLTPLTSFSKSGSEYLIQEVDEKSLTAEIKDVDLRIADGEIFKNCTMFKCADCSVLFTNKEVLDNHLARVHSGKLSVDLQLNDMFRLNEEGDSTCKEYL